MRLLTAPTTRFANILSIIFVMLLKNAPAFAEAASRRQADEN
jgi:hypothetical protein